MKPRLLLILFLPFLVFLGAFFLFAFASTSTYRNWKVEDESSPGMVTRDALQTIGVEQVDWKTLIISVSKEVDLPRETLWSSWSELSRWPRWSQPLHKSVRWLSDSGWRPGAEFEQARNLGFPVGEEVSRERVGHLVEGEQVMWWNDEEGTQSCHIWKFEKLSDERTRITNTEVFRGTSIGMIKILVGGKWLRLFDRAVDGLVKDAGQSVHAGGHP